MWTHVIQTSYWNPANGKKTIKNWTFKDKRAALIGKRRLQLLGLDIVKEFDTDTKEEQCQ